jgi:predicted dehydrogenase
MCLEAGKAVLCEKPMGINAGQVEEMIRLANHKQVFLMEAMWTRCLPVIRKAREWIEEGRIGKPMLMRGSFCFNAPFNPGSRLYDPQLAGGGLLDVGIYPIAMANMVFGSDVVSNQSTFIPAESGVDRVSAGILQFKSGAIAQWSSGVGLQTEHAVVVYGEDGYLLLPEFWHGTKIELNRPGMDPEICEIPHPGNGYEYEAEEVAACLREGKLQSDIMPLRDTLEIHKIMDQAREQWGLKYPME